MEQTFNDLLRERAEEERGFLHCALWMFVETSAGIMGESMTSIVQRNRNIFRIAVATAFLLSIPLVAMQFTKEVTWSPFDFVVAGGLLFGAGLAYELVSRRARNTVYRFAVGIAVVTSLLLVWINLAVGFIGSEDNPANLLYGGVLAVGFVGAILARLRPRGMSHALFAMALVQALVPVIALLIWKPQVSSAEAFVDMVRVLILNGFFVMLFVGSGLLFRRAASEQT